MTVSRGRLWAGRGMLAVGTPVLDFGARFFRTFLLARFLAPEAFGLSVILAAVLGVAEMAADGSQDKFVLLHSGEAAERSMGAAHGLQLVRGLLLTAILLALAGPLARLFQVPTHIGDFQLAALIMLLRAPAHLGTVRQQRNYEFGPIAAAMVVTQIASIGGTVLGILWLGDHRAILLGFAAEGLANTLATHALAPGRYRVTTDRATLGAALRFSLPLMANGMALALVALADRLMVGGLLGASPLALYALLMTLAVVPISPVFRALGVVSLTMLARAAAAGPHRDNTLVFLTWFYGLVALGYALGMALVLDIAVPLVFGVTYQVSHWLHVLAVLIAFLRLSRGMPTAVLLERSQTGRLTLANLLGALGLAAAYLLAWWWPSLEAVLIGLVLGDLLGLAVLLDFSLRAAAGARDALMRAVGVNMLGGATLVAAMAAMPAVELQPRLLLALMGGAVLACSAWGCWRAWRMREEGG